VNSGAAAAPASSSERVETVRVITGVSSEVVI
jgi:hypothetical protein